MVDLVKQEVAEVRRQQKDAQKQRRQGGGGPGGAARGGRGGGAYRGGAAGGSPIVCGLVVCGLVVLWSPVSSIIFIVSNGLCLCVDAVLRITMWMIFESQL